MKSGWYFIVPFVILLGTLFWLNAPPETAALFGTASICILGSIFSYNDKRLKFSTSVAMPEENWGDLS